MTAKHRDLMAAGGVLCLAAAAFLIWLPLALIVFGVALLYGAYLLSPEAAPASQEESDGI